MKNYFRLLSLILLFLLLTSHASYSQHPVFRWDVKTLTDSSGINWMDEIEKAKHRRYASIEGLTKKDIQFTSCHDVGKNTRRTDEMRVVKMKVRLVSVKKESNDNDYHVVMESLTNDSNQMVAEIPDPNDEEYQGAEYADLRNLLTQLRTMVETMLGKNVTTSPKTFPADTKVIIYGVPFFDCQHPGSVTGASVDFRELHPVLEIDMLN